MNIVGKDFPIARIYADILPLMMVANDMLAANDILYVDDMRKPVQYVYVY